MAVDANVNRVAWFARAHDFSKELAIVAKRKVKQKIDVSGIPMNPDDEFSQITDNAAYKNGKAGELVSRGTLKRYLRVPSFAFRFLLGTEGMSIGSMFTLAGAPGSFKSTMLAEIQRWHYLNGGGGITMETESKDQDDLRAAILDYDFTRFKMVECQTLEDWQGAIAAKIDEFKALEEQFQGRRFPVCIGIDSIMGKASQYTIDQVKKEGHVTPGWNLYEHKAITKWLQVATALMTGWPFSLVVVGHLKDGMPNFQGRSEKYIPGAVAVDYQSVTEVAMVRSSTEVFRDPRDLSKNRQVIPINMSIMKSNNSPKGLRIKVPLSIWQDKDELTGEYRTHARFEWNVAAVNLIAECRKGHQNTKEPSAQQVVSPVQIRDICDITPGKDGWVSERLGVTASDGLNADEIGAVLEKRQDVLDELYGVVGVAKKKFYDINVPYEEQILEDKAAQRDRDAAIVAAREMAARAESQENV